MKPTSRELLAETFGLAAHELGKPRIPALDSDLMSMLNQPVGGDAAALMLRWLAAWDSANLMHPNER